MAARCAAASLFRLLKFYREIPGSEWDSCPDKLRSCARVSLVTRAAASPMGRPVDVNKMKIAITVTEFGRFGRVLFGRQRGIVTAET